jgi:FixJ family two-component response regulator
MNRSIAWVYKMNTASVTEKEVRLYQMEQPSPMIFVVDDDISVRESLELLFRYEGWQVETFISAQEFFDHPRSFAPCCLVLDFSLPGLNGLEVQKRIAVERPNMPIIFITGYGDIPMTVQAMKAGAVEFLTKPFGEEVLLGAIRSAVERSKSLAGRDAELRALRERYARLTSREREVLARVVAGLLNKQVGCELGISEITVKAHRGNVMRKMQADSLAQLVNMATRLRLTRMNSSSLPALSGQGSGTDATRFSADPWPVTSSNQANGRSRHQRQPDHR